jgi:small GTP-binding protein
MTTPEDEQQKIVFVGRSTVGKTSIVNCAISGERASETTRPTVGGNFVTKVHTSKGNTFSLQIWDTAGQEKYRSMTPLFFRSASLAVIVFSIIDPQSFGDIEGWYSSVITSVPSISIVIVGNKSDLHEDRVISFEEGETAARNIRVKYCETSAKDGTGISELFDLIVDELALGKQISERIPSMIERNSFGKCC